MSDKKRLLFLYTGNACRSQMADGLARKAWSNSSTFTQPVSKSTG